MIKNICNEKNIVFIHIPKTGGTTIEHIFFNRNGSSEHKDITFYQDYFDYYVFSFVRNPYTRIISIYNYYINGGNKTKSDINKLRKDLDINDFLDEYNENNLSFLKTQYSYLQDSKYIDFVGRFENFSRDLQLVCDKLNIKYIDINKRKTDYTNNYLITPKFIDMISNIYHIDFVKYNYKKINIDKSITLSELLDMI